MKTSHTYNRAKYLAMGGGIDVLYLSSHGSYIIHADGSETEYVPKKEAPLMLIFDDRRLPTEPTWQITLPLNSRPKWYESAYPGAPSNKHRR